MKTERLSEFYDGRYVEGYMEDWPESKKQRVGELFRQLGLTQRGRALDFGCGQGVFTRVMRAALPDWAVYGTELSDVALRIASARVPDCTFIKGDELAAAGPFDFIFTHHVLEHVLDLDATLAEMSQISAPGALMLHILPCGNPGSFEHRLASWGSGGVQSDGTNRFFFEDAGHLRRVTSPELVAAADRRGWRLRDQKYANHFWGAVDWITELDLGFIRTLTTIRPGMDATTKARIVAIRAALAAIHLARRIPKSPIRRLLKGSVESEWTRRQNDPGGSEMYLLFERP